MKFLFITRTDWNDPPRARHQLARSLSKRFEVVFVSKNKMGIPSLDISNPEKNITVIFPNWYFESKINLGLPILNKLYQNWLFSKLLKKYKGYRVINFDFTASDLHKYFGENIYFCNDDFLSKKRSRYNFISCYWSFKQKKVARKAVFCTSVSKYLQNKLSKYNNRSHLLLTGATSINETKNKPIDRKSKEIKIVYVGWLAKLDMDWVLELAINKKFNIYLIGPYSNNQIKDIKGIKNIVIVGTKVGHELNQYLLDADVCIAPYIRDRDTKEVYTMPNKFWLYLSFGKPIVTCQIDNLVNLPEKFVYRAKNKTEFLANIDKALSEDSPSIIGQRIQYIKQNTWDNRVEELIGLYKKYTVS